MIALRTIVGGVPEYLMSGDRVNVYGLMLRNQDVTTVAVSERQDEKWKFWRSRK
jgi:hypothetical protein